MNWQGSFHRTLRLKKDEIVRDILQRGRSWEKLRWRRARDLFEWNGSNEVTCTSRIFPSALLLAEPLVRVFFPPRDLAVSLRLRTKTKLDFKLVVCINGVSILI